MPRGYRDILATIARLAALRPSARALWRFLLAYFAVSIALSACYATYQLYNAAQQRNANYDYQPASHARFPVTVKGQPKPESYQPNCKQPNSKEDADLCAQWSAVAQVTETNRLASISLQLSIGALIFTIFGTGLLVWTLWETRQTARRELRAYVSIEMVGMEFTLGLGKAFAHIKLKNGGQTPAYLCCHNGNVFVRTDEEAEHDILHRPHVALGRAQPFTLHMNDPQGGSIYAHDPITLPDLKDVVEGDKWVYVFGTVFYRDTFGIDRQTRFCVKTDDLRLPSTDNPAKFPRQMPPAKPCEWVMAHFHNDST